MPDHALTAIGIVVGCVLTAAVAVGLRTRRLWSAVECAAASFGAVGCVVLLRRHLPGEPPPLDRLLAPDVVTVLLVVAAVGLLLLALLRFRAELKDMGRELPS